jgi:hypothetical protein
MVRLPLPVPYSAARNGPFRPGTWLCEEVIPLNTSEKLLLDSYRAIPDKTIQESILKITANSTKQG